MSGRLAIAAAATFSLDDDGRILRENDPDRSPGPRLFAAGGPDGSLALLRRDVPDDTARAVRERVAAGPGWVDVYEPPPWLPAIAERLGRDAPVTSTEFSLVYILPPSEPASSVRIVRSDGEAGARLLARLRREGLPPHLVAAGFASLDDFWAPWCVAEEAGEIAAIAFAARLGAGGAEVGVYTFPGFRGRGLAAAVTAAWSGLPELADRTLFYSTLTTNRSSRRVAARLGLPWIGAGLRIV